MRISTSQIYAQGIRGFQTQQVNIARLQQQISSEQKHLRPSDDPAEVARSLELEQIVNRTNQYMDNIDIAESRLKVEENTLKSVNDSLVRVRELAVQGASTILSQTARDALVSELRERLSEISSLVNTVDPHGDYLFAGNQGDTKPFTERLVQGYSVIDFIGDQSSRSVQVSEFDRIETSDSGADVFFKIPSSYAVHAVTDLTNTGNAQATPIFHSDASLVTGNDYSIRFTSATTFDIVNDTTTTTVSSGVTYASGQAIEFDGLKMAITGTPANGDRFDIRDGQYQDIFTTLQKMTQALERGASTDVERTRLTATMDESLEDIDNALTHVNAYRSRIGGRMNIMDAHREQNEIYMIDTESAISLLRDLDYPEAITTLAQNTLSLEAAQAAFARVQGISLFNYI